jgi:hypothetical protein
MVDAWSSPQRHEPPLTGGDVEWILFVEGSAGYWASCLDHRQWRIEKVITGWRLEFWDPGDVESTFAGIHASVENAKREAAAHGVRGGSRGIPMGHSPIAPNE